MVLPKSTSSGGGKASEASAIVDRNVVPLVSDQNNGSRTYIQLDAIELRGIIVLLSMKPGLYNVCGAGVRLTVRAVMIPSPCKMTL